MTFARPLWAFALAVFTSACYYGYMPLCDGLLSHWVWQPLTKLTYGTYLLHPVIIETMAGNMTSYFHFSTSEILMHAFALVCMSYAGAIVMWCLVEKPFGTLVDATLRKRREPKQLPTDRCEPKQLPTDPNNGERKIDAEEP